jgi:hypothetical protein
VNARKCRACGCTDEHACITDDGSPCFWVEGDLCSACASREAASKGGAELGLSPADLEALTSAPPIGIELDGTQALIIMAALQLALRHPEYDDSSPTSAFVNSIAKGLAERLSLTPNLKALCNVGWRANDAPPTVSRLILPPGC